MSKSISVVIPNYNGADLLKANLPPLMDALISMKAAHEIIIVDDASTDDSINFVKNHYPDIKLVVNEVNQGFSKTMNRGIFASQNDLVLSLNSDVVLHKDYFIPLFKYFDAPDTFAVAGKIIGLNDDKPQDTAKYPSCSFGRISGTQNYSIVNIKSQSDLGNIPSFFTSGANTLYDRKKLQFLGGFTEMYSPYYGEDLDLSLKAWRLGWKSYYEEKAICRHPASSTIKKYNRPKKIRIITKRNKMIMHFTHLNGLNLSIFFLNTIVKLLFSWIVFDFIYYTAIKKFISLIPNVIEERKILKCRAKQLDRQLISLNFLVSELQNEINNRFDIKIS